MCKKLRESGSTKREGSRILVLAIAAVLMGAGCVTSPPKDVMVRRGILPIPVVKIRELPSPVQATIEHAAAGRRILRVNRVQQFEGPVYRAYISTEAGPELVTVAHDGRLVEHAEVVSFETMPVAVQTTALDAIDGEIGLCRRCVRVEKPVYYVDYLVMGEEPVFAVIEASGRLLTIVGYGEEDGDE